MKIIAREQADRCDEPQRIQYKHRSCQFGLHCFLGSIRSRDKESPNSRTSSTSQNRQGTPSTIMSTTSRGRRQRRNLKTSSIILLQLLIVINCAKAIDYAAYRTDVIPPGITRDSARTTRGLLEELNLRYISKSPNLQDGTEHLLHYGALLRAQILDTFGRLVYDKYDDFSMPEIEALYRIYRETLERRYNIFDIVPKILEDPDTRPTKICSHINRNVRTCLKEISRDCMNIRIHDEPHQDTLSKPARNVTKKIYHLAEIPKNYPGGFSLNAVMDLLRRRDRPHLRITPGLFSGLLHNVRYDNFDDGVRTAEREIVTFLANKSEDFPSINGEFIEKTISVSQLLKNYLTNETFFCGKVARHAAYLAEHVLREVDAVDENIELLGTIYDNSTINLGYLFKLILPNDTVDRDIVEARDYLLHKILEKNIVEKYLRIEKYQQARPDQLIMEIFGQLRDIGFAVDIVTSLHAHARFWHRSHMVENLNDLLELFDAYENLRGLPNFSRLIKAADQIKNNLQNSRNVTVELLCTRPRACLRIGLELVFKCATVNDETKAAIKSFLEETACDCSSSENFTKKPRGDIGIKITTKAPEDTVENETENAKVSKKNKMSEKPLYDIGTYITAKTPQKIGTETDDSSSPSDKRIPLNYPILMDHITESFETWTNIYDIDYEDDYSNWDEIGESIEKNSGEILLEKEKSKEQSCVGEDCISSKCNGTECVERAMKCTGENCTVDCSGDNCLQLGNCTGDGRCAVVNSNHNCTGKDCSQNTDEVRRDCEGSRCAKNSTEIKCEGADCSAICENGNCNESDGSPKCKGDNCRNNSTAEISCKGSDCTDASEKIPRLSVNKNQCQGSNCSGIDCTGNNCTANTTLDICKGPECSNSSITQNCTGLDCPKINCTGESCPIKETIGCEGKDCPKNFTTCIGNDCATSKNEKNCTGLDCPRINCTGKSCPVKETIGCEGKDCPKNVTTCTGTDCATSKKEKNCTGVDCPRINCTGESCPIKETIGCEGKDCPKNVTTCTGTDCATSKNEKNCTGLDCPRINCTGENCPIKETIGCEGKDCPMNFTTCIGNDCATSKNEKNCTGLDCPRINCAGENCSIKETIGCEGKDCPKNFTTCIGNDCATSKNEKNCTGLDCPRINCTGKSCPIKETIGCEGKDCPKNFTTSIGNDCATSKNEKNCTGLDCPRINCTGENCPIKETIGCEGKDCPKNFTTCIGNDCATSKNEKNCTGLDCPRINCTGENCPIKETIGCEGKDCPKNFTTCTGTDCATSKNEKNCTGPNCTSEQKAQTCKGDDCLVDQYRKDDCKGSNCSDNGSMQSDCDEESCEDYYIENKCDGPNCTESSMEICDGPDCDYIEDKNDCKDTNCTDEKNVNVCSGPNCSINKKQIKIDCKGDNCTKVETTTESCSGKNCPINVKPQIGDKNLSENTTDILVSSLVKGKVETKSCPEKNCSTKVAPPTREKKRSEDSTAPSHPSLVKAEVETESCSGKNCSTKVESPTKENKRSKNSTDRSLPSLVEGEIKIETCIGKNCSKSDDPLIREKERLVNSTATSVPSYAEKEVETQSCPGKNCPIKIEPLVKGKLPTDNSTNSSIPLVVKQEVETKNCTGKNCPINIEPLVNEKLPTGNSTNSSIPLVVEQKVETKNCTGKNCPINIEPLVNKKLPTDNSTNSSIPLVVEQEVETKNCTGKNCSINIEPQVNEKLPTDNSTNSSIPSLVKQEVETKNCTGKNCSINIEPPIRKNIPTENSTNSITPNKNSRNSSIPSSPSTRILVANRTIFCDNGDLYYRRKLKRLNKMRRIFGNSTRNRAKAWEAISGSSNLGSEKTETNEKTEFSNFRRSQQNNSGILRAILGAQSANLGNNVTASRYEILNAKNRTKLDEPGNNVHNKTGNLASEKDSTLREKKIHKKLRKHLVETGGNRKERIGIKTTMVEDEIGNEDNGEIATKRKTDETKDKKLRDKLKKIRRGRYRIKTTLVKDDDYEDDQGKESSDDLNLEEILTQRVREELKKLQKDLRTNSTRLRRGKKFRVVRKLRDHDLEDSRDSGSKDFSIYREKPIRKKRISDLRNRTREEDVERVPNVDKTDLSDDKNNQKLKYILRVPPRIPKPKYRSRQVIDKNNEFNEVEKNTTVTS